MRTAKRPYRKTRRAEEEERTRARIVDAAEKLHGTVGPALTSISAVAAEAGVTRATVYRHFPDEESLFLACSGQWFARQPALEPRVWRRYDDPLDRLRTGLTDLYRYYRAGQDMIALVLRDAHVVPDRVQSERIEQQRSCLRVLLEPFPERRRRTLRAAVAHAAAFPTWRSLCVDQGLSDGAAVDLMLGLVRGAREDPVSRRSGGSPPARHLPSRRSAPAADRRPVRRRAR